MKPSLWSIEFILDVLVDGGNLETRPTKLLVVISLPSSRPMAYTSASTIIRILEQKGVVKSEKEGKAHIYQPLLKKADYEKKTLNHVINNVFKGTPSQLVKRLISDGKLTEAERNEIRRLISEEL